MPYVLVACPTGANMQQIRKGVYAPFCASCGQQFTALPILQPNNVEQINQNGYELIRTDYEVAEDLFRCALKLNPNDFAALIGIAISFQIRLESTAFENRNIMAVGFYLLKRQQSGRWKLCDEEAEMAKHYCSYLDAAISRAPNEDMRVKLMRYRKCNIEDAFVRADNIIHGRVE